MKWKRAVRDAAHWMGVEVRLRHRQFDDHVRRCLLACNHGTLFDIGLHEGDFTARALAGGFRGTVVGVDPLPDFCDRVRARFAGQPRVVVRCCAVNDRCGEVTFHRTAAAAASSMLAPLPGLVANTPTTRVAGEHVVVAETLDSLSSGLQPPFFLKLDVQGAEARALAGATRTLEATQFVLLEASLMPLYEGSPVVEELIGLLRMQGFHPVDMERGHWLEKDQALAQVDLLFARPSSSQ